VETEHARGTLREGSRLTGATCPRCRWQFKPGDVVELLTGNGKTLAVHVTCTRAEPPIVKHVPKKRVRDVDPYALERAEREAYEAGRW
jgi:hypothetical protein